jgi:alpha-methylacyl-CoA racemase
MIDGAALLALPYFGYLQTGRWRPERGTNLVDGGAPFYDAYQTADGRWLSVAAIEPRFYADLLTLLELPPDLPDRADPAAWPELRRVFAAAVRTRTRDDWCARAEGLNPCVAPVLDAGEAPADRHNQARGVFVTDHGLTQPAPAPKFSRTPARIARRPPVPGEHSAEILRQWGVPARQRSRWLTSGAVPAAHQASLLFGPTI